MEHRRKRIALAGDVELNLLAPYFRKAGWDVYVPPGFGAWRQEALDPDSAMGRFGADIVFDVTAHDAALAKEVPGFFDERMAALASMPYSLAGMAAIVEEAEFALLASSRKFLAIDADDTLWSGTLSEDGADGLAPFAEFQRGLKELSDSGVPLVLLTKNDPESFSPAHDPFAMRKMPLSIGDFTCVKADWNSKFANIEATARELDLGLDSAVFVDDNPLERAQMAAAHAEVAIPPFPKNLHRPETAGQFLRRLREYFFSANASGLEEDRLRALDYKARRLRLGIKAATKEEYLRDLKLRVEARTANERDVPRLAQMASKTNQFNATTIRRSEDEFSALLRDKSKRLFVYHAADRFADQGIVAYVVADIPARRITDFVMSCRAMGRTLEFFIWRHVAGGLGFEPAVDFVPSAKNAPARDFICGDKAQATYYETTDNFDGAVK